jgi:DNA-binding NtrC family response regulator
MKKEVVVLDTDQKQGNNLCRLLANHQYGTAPLSSLKALDDYLEQSECRALIMNLDNISVTNKILKQLKAKKPLINIIAVSERQFHPELEEALREYISVCLAKPVDTDELMYWLKTIFENDNKPEG